MLEIDKIYHGDCYQLLDKLPDGSVDCIITDPPYGTTNCKWDVKIDLAQLWQKINRVIKKNGAIIIFTQLPFAVDVINANRKNFRYEWIWQKTNPRGFLNANRMPMRAHENILVFYGALPTFNPQFSQGTPYAMKRRTPSPVYGEIRKMVIPENLDGRHYPLDVQIFANDASSYDTAHGKRNRHPTQKPLALVEYLMKTYTNPGELVLDCFSGSGTTAVAAVNTGRHYICMELAETYYKMSVERVKTALPLVPSA